MSVVSYSFLLFLLIVCLVYYMVPKKWQWVVLLAAGIIFYAGAGVSYLAVVGLTALVVYGCSLLMQKNLDQQEELLKEADRKTARKIKNEMKHKRKRVLVCGLVVVIGILVLFKGSDFLIENVNVLLSHTVHTQISAWKLVAPLGISFYSFMMIAYLVDLYHGKISAQKNFLKYLTYVLYFPHITQGPIGRYDPLGTEMFAEHRFDYDMFRKGIWLMIWGYFKKLVIADRIAPFVTTVIKNAPDYSGPIFLLVGVIYSIQIYCDFSGCMDIVRGSSECLGIRLKENFRRPYFSRNMPEFWRRWHISLGEFFRENVFYPVSTSAMFLKLNTAGRKRFGNEWGRNIASCLPILCVWILTGVWHGANWNYIGWGVYHGILICLSAMFEQPIKNLMEKAKINTDHMAFQVFQMLRTFFLCLIGRLIFLGNGLSDSFYMIGSAFCRPQAAYTMKLFVLRRKEWAFVLVCMLLLLAVSIAQEILERRGINMTIRDWLGNRNVVFRGAVLLAGVLLILCFGVYGAGAGATFIYEQF